MSAPRFLRDAALAIAAACVVNAAAYFAGRAAGADYLVPHGPTQELGPLGVDAVLFVTTAVMVLGAVGWLGLRRLAPARAWPIWCALAGLLFVASFLPFGSAFATTTKVFLGLMHFTTLGATALAVTRSRKEGVA